MNITNTTAECLNAIANGAMATFPNVGAWMINAQKRQAACLLALNPETWEDTLKASFLSEVMADTYCWSHAEALRIVNGHVATWNWDTTKALWWKALRSSEADPLDYEEAPEEPVLPYGSFPGEI